MNRPWLTIFVTYLAGLCLFTPAHALNTRRVQVNCEVGLMFRQRASDFSLKQVGEKMDALEVLLASYSSAGEYYFVPENESRNLPTLILEKVGDLRSVLDFLQLGTDESVAAAAALRELWLAIYRPYAEMQVAMSFGTDPDSKVGEEFVHKHYTDSVLWLFEGGWLRYDGSAPRIQEVRKLLEHAGIEEATPAFKRARREMIIKILTNARPRGMR